LSKDYVLKIVIPLFRLAELQTVKHSKDKAIVDEREQRLQQMIQLQKDMAKQGSGSQSASGPGSGSVVTTATTITPAPTPIGVDLCELKPPKYQHLTRP